MAALETLNEEEILLLKYSYDLHTDQQSFLHEYQIIKEHLNENKL